MPLWVAHIQVRFLDKKEEQASIAKTVNSIVGYFFYIATGSIGVRIFHFLPSLERPVVALDEWFDFYLLSLRTVYMDYY